MRSLVLVSRQVRRTIHFRLVVQFHRPRRSKKRQGDQLRLRSERISDQGPEEVERRTKAKHKGEAPQEKQPASLFGCCIDKGARVIPERRTGVGPGERQFSGAGLGVPLRLVLCNFYLLPPVLTQMFSHLKETGLTPVAMMCFVLKRCRSATLLLPAECPVSLSAFSLLTSYVCIAHKTLEKRLFRDLQASSSFN